MGSGASRSPGTSSCSGTRPPTGSSSWSGRRTDMRSGTSDWKPDATAFHRLPRISRALNPRRGPRHAPRRDRSLERETRQTLSPLSSATRPPTASSSWSGRKTDMRSGTSDWKQDATVSRPRPRPSHASRSAPRTSSCSWKGSICRASNAANAITAPSPGPPSEHHAGTGFFPRRHRII